MTTIRKWQEQSTVISFEHYLWHFKKVIYGKKEKRKKCHCQSYSLEYVGRRWVGMGLVLHYAKQQLSGDQSIGPIGPGDRTIRSIGPLGINRVE